MRRGKKLKHDSLTVHTYICITITLLSTKASLYNFPLGFNEAEVVAFAYQLFVVVIWSFKGPFSKRNNDAP